MTDHFAGDRAARYDDLLSDMFDADAVGPVVDFLAELAGGGPALEFGIGTGRIALPLSERGIEVHGIDLSPDMVDRMRSKPGADRITTTIGSFATTSVGGGFRLVYLVFNTINNLTDVGDQVSCFANAASHLGPGGFFVVECGVPPVRSLPPGQSVVPFSVTEEHLGFDEIDTAAQALTSHHFYRRPDGTYERNSIPFRYVWPSELDLMARLAGLELHGRWAGWDRAEFTHESTKHVSVWVKPTD